MTPYGSSRPVVAMLSVSQPFTMAANLAELASGPAVEAPPDADGHAILQSDHRLNRVVHLVVIAHFAVFSQLLIELGKRIERTCQLMGVSPVIILFASIIPLQGLVVVQRVTAGNYGLAEHL